MAGNIITFLGPTLDVGLAKELLSDSFYLPPAKSGDIIKAVRLKPSVIVIIDGYFNQINSVWHKEILFALSLGIKVFGASSMGALRALELEEFGMVGFGEVFKWFKVNKSYDDDEVILTHLESDRGYLHLSKAMINVRFTLLNARNKNIINLKEFKKLIKISKTMFYKNRTYEKIFKIYFKDNALSHKESALKEWILNNEVDQKEKDAINLLRYINSNRNKLISKEKKNFIFSRTQYFNALYAKSMSQPFIDYRECLPMNEKVCLAARLLGKRYYHIKNLSLLSQLIYNLSKSKFESVTASDWCDIGCDIDGLEDIDISCLNDSRSKEFKSIFNYIFKFYHEDDDGCDAKINSFVKSYQLLTGDSEVNNTLILIGYMWSILYDTFCDSDLIISEKILLKQIAIFMRDRVIENKSVLYEWMSKNAIDKNQFIIFIKRVYIFDYFVKRRNLHAIDLYNISENNGYFWLEHSLYASNVYQKIKRLLSDRSSLLEAVENFKCELKANGANFIFLTDFYTEANFLNFIKKLSLGG